MFWELAALFRFSFQLAIPEVKSENDASPTPQKKKKTYLVGHWAWKLEMNYSNFENKNFPPKSTSRLVWPRPIRSSKRIGYKNLKKKGCFCWTELTRNGSGWFSFIFCIMKKNEPNKKKYKNKFGVFGSLLI